MNFNIKLENRTVSEEELLNDLQNVAKKFGKKQITVAGYNKLGKFHASTLSRRFDTWHNALEKNWT